MNVPDGTARGEGSQQRLSMGEPITWVVLALAAGMLLIGAVFVFAPRSGAALFGVPAPEGPGEAYLRAIGFRDLALSLYIAALALCGSRRSLGLLLGLTVLIPACDVVLVAAVSGLTWPLALHAGTGAVFAALALWCFPSRRGGAGRP